MRTSHLLLTACLAALGASPAFAQNETILIAASLETEIPNLLSRTGTQVDVITAVDIKNGGYRDISQTLSAEAPGLFISSQHGPFDYVDVSMQGSRTAEVLWLVDGIRINNRLYAGTTPLDALPASMVERIEVMQGGQALFYGTQASAGAINIVTKSFSDTPDGALSIGGDSNYGSHIDGFFRDGFGRSKIVIYGSADISNGFSAFPAADFQPSATLRERGYHVFTGGGKYQFDATDTLRLSVSYEKNMAHLDYPGSQDVNTAFNQRNEDLVTAKIDYMPTESVNLFIKGYYHSWASHFTEFDNNGGGPLIIVDDHDAWGYTDSGVNAMAKIDLTQGLTTELGYDFQTYNGNDAVLVIAPQAEDVHAVFGRIESNDLITGAHLALGGRYNIPSVGEDAFVWNASGQYDITDALYVKGSVGTNFRLPTAEELFADDPNDELGNPNLRPEHTLGFNASLGGHLDLGMLPLDWRLTGFYREVKNLIDLDGFNVATNQDVFGNIPGKVITRGIEAYFSIPLMDVLSADADFSYASVRGSGSSVQFNRIPETLFKFGFDYHPTDLPFGVNLNLQNVGSHFDTIGGGVGRQSYGGYTTLNLGARYFIDSERHHRIGLNVTNLFDTDYASHLRRGTNDVSGASYLVHDRGQPRTVYLNYTLSLP